MVHFQPSLKSLKTSLYKSTSYPIINILTSSTKVRLYRKRFDTAASRTASTEQGKSIRSFGDLLYDNNFCLRVTHSSPTAPADWDSRKASSHSIWRAAASCPIVTGLALQFQVASTDSQYLPIKPPREFNSSTAGY